jgi:hypothetical protein
MAVFYEISVSIFSPHFIARSYRKLNDLTTIRVAGKEQANYETGIYVISVSDHFPYVIATNSFHFIFKRLQCSVLRRKQETMFHGFKKQWSSSVNTVTSSFPSLQSLLCVVLSL